MDHLKLVFSDVIVPLPNLLRTSKLSDILPQITDQANAFLYNAYPLFFNASSPPELKFSFVPEVDLDKTTLGNFLSDHGRVLVVSTRPNFGDGHDAFAQKVGDLLNREETLENDLKKVTEERDKCNAALLRAFTDMKTLRDEKSQLETVNKQLKRELWKQEVRTGAAALDDLAQDLAVEAEKVDAMKRDLQESAEKVNAMKDKAQESAGKIDSLMERLEQEKERRRRVAEHVSSLDSNQ
ncbi:hypothetical protein HK104_010719 [Borealophlyctis nickersoniae]|nr:hypothetical protein HK104_010719 [Borealophlyctis nickersoniae]